MRRLLRFGLGLILGGAALLGLWGAGLLEPPESLSRGLAIVSATYPGPGGEVTIDRIPCRPMNHLRFYVVCTEDCEGVWRIVAVRGLVASNLVNFNQRPPEAPEELRRLANDAIASDRLALNAGTARELLGCYLRLGGLREERVLREGDLDALSRARAGRGGGLQAFAEGLEGDATSARIPVQETPDGFASQFNYWDADAPGRPIVQMSWGLRRNGTIALFDSRELALTDDSATGNTPGKPPI